MLRLIFSFFLLFTFICSSFSALAETRIAIIDVSYILSQSAAAKDVLEQRKELHTQFLAEISRTEQDLRVKEKKLLEERDTIPQEDFAKKKQDYERRILETGRLVREKKQALENVFSVAMGKVQAQLTDIVEEIAEEKGYELVLTKQNVVIGSSSLDITQEAVDKLNAALPTLKLDQPE